MNKRVLYSTIGIVFVVCYLCLLMLPASWLVKKISQQVPVFSASGEVSGHLWHGTAKNLVAVSRGAEMPLGDISWWFDWTSIIFFKPCVKFTTAINGYNGSGNICIYSFAKKIMVRQLVVDFPASEIAKWLALEIQGKLQTNIKTMVIDNKQLSFIRGDIIWSQAEFYNGEQWLELGKLLISLYNETQANKVAVHWLDMKDKRGFSPIGVDVEMIVDNGKLARVLGALQPHGTPSLSMLDTLNLLSDSQEAGIYYLEKLFH